MTTMMSFKAEYKGEVDPVDQTFSGYPWLVLNGMKEPTRDKEKKVRRRQLTDWVRLEGKLFTQRRAQACQFQVEMIHS